MPETFLARFPVSVSIYIDPRVFSLGFGLRPSANTENSRRRPEKPLVPRVLQTRLGGEICSSDVIMHRAIWTDYMPLYVIIMLGFIIFPFSE